MFNYQQRAKRRIPLFFGRAAPIFIWIVIAASIAIVGPALWGKIPNAIATSIPTPPLAHGAIAKLSTTTTTVTGTRSTKPGGPSKLIEVGPSRKECVEPDLTGTGLVSLQAAITGFDEKTHTVVTCVSAYLNGAATWHQWIHSWVTNKMYGFTSWVAEAPKTRQLVLGVDLIPNSLANVRDPLKWERLCAEGNFNSYATQFGTTLVHAGLENSVLRLGPEMNGMWENDFIGFTGLEQRLWASCFANEVTAVRRAVGEHFLIDWNPNACVENIPYSHYYPGNAYVDILGLDLFDESCIAPQTPYSFKQLANEPVSLTGFEAFAAAKKKPMSLPEWALSATPVKDDPNYINGIGSTFANRDFAFEDYFDFQRPRPLLGPSTPLSLVAFQKWFSTTDSTG